MAEETPDRENGGLFTMDSSESRWVFQRDDDDSVFDDENEDLPVRMSIDSEDDDNSEQKLIRTGPRIDSFDVEALEVPGAHRNDYEVHFSFKLIYGIQVTV
ncbi:Potassium transporter [Thalictrum thalictroides]|uniref:Potassium transporter n=1 Tax=Thalictrum thalictroides TaxID=46969 RepID=A0A7J6V7E6_THATH|nr:Potassium transporter [Thalictrum thalictroides]